MTTTTAVVIRLRKDCVRCSCQLYPKISKYSLSWVDAHLRNLLPPKRVYNRNLLCATIIVYCQFSNLSPIKFDKVSFPTFFSLRLQWSKRFFGKTLVVCSIWQMYGHSNAISGWIPKFKWANAQMHKWANLSHLSDISKLWRTLWHMDSFIVIYCASPIYWDLCICILMFVNKIPIDNINA